METPEQCVKYVPLTIKTSEDVIDVVLVSLLLILNKFHTLLRCFDVRFEQINVV